MRCECVSVMRTGGWLTDSNNCRLLLCTHVRARHVDVFVVYVWETKLAFTSFETHVKSTHFIHSFTTTTRPTTTRPTLKETTTPAATVTDVIVNINVLRLHEVTVSVCGVKRAANLAAVWLAYFYCPWLLFHSKLASFTNASHYRLRLRLLVSDRHDSVHALSRLFLY